LTRFYARRALRTLPNYYFILAIYFLFPIAAGGNPLTPLWKFLTFTQNFDLKSGSSFSHAWSLCIEEQFYVLLPLISLFVLVRLKSVRGMWIVIVGTMLICACMRFLMLHKVGMDGGLYRTYIYYSSWCRFDELLPGVALALVRNYHPLVWQEWTAKGGRNLLLGILLSGFALLLFQSFNYDPELGFSGFTTTFGYTILACGFGCLTLAALSSYSPLARIRIPGASSLAIWSYALYLVHKPLMNALIPVFKSNGVDVNGILGISLMFLISILAAYLQFKWVETPFMRLRARLYSPRN
jgi:peptidoglycan/LPS O-acetylase OafA/YrhL